MGLYMNYPGLKGDATEKGFKDWITLLSMRFAAERTVNSSVGSGSSREASNPNIRDMEVTKLLDAASAGLFRASVTLPKGQTVQLASTSTGAEGEAYFKLTLEDVLITSYQIGSGDRPLERITLSSAKISMTVTATDSANNPLAPMTAGFDLVQNAPI
jgi:type VI secretion system secreted protein Hcp